MRSIAIGLIVLAMATLSRAEDRPITGARWYASVQRIGAKYRGGTDAQKQLQRQQLLEELLAMEPAVVQFTAQVKDVRWKDGIATITTTSFLPPTPRGAQAPLLMTLALPLEVRMDAETAASIRAGTRLQFKGTMKFNRSNFTIIGPNLGEQQMYTVKSRLLGLSHIGTYTSPDCVVIIGGKEYPSRWTREPE